MIRDQKTRDQKTQGRMILDHIDPKIDVAGRTCHVAEDDVKKV